MRTKRFIIVVASLLALASCGEPAPEAEGLYGGLCVTLGLPDTATKASTDYDSAAEYAVREALVFLFDATGALYRPPVTLSGADGTATFERVRVATYTVAAVVNPPVTAADALAAVRERGDLDRIPVDLGDNDPTSAFVMYGSPAVAVQVNAAGEATPVSVTVRRLVSRVRLVSIKCGIAPAFGALDVEHVFLENGHSSWNLTASLSASDYYNYAGRAKGMNDRPAGPFCDESTVEYPGLVSAYGNPLAEIPYGTVWTNGGRPLRFYTFENDLAAGEADHFDGATDGPVYTRLVVRTSFGGRSYWYPVTIGPVLRNRSYDVTLEITGPGSDDPNKEPKTGTLTVDVTVYGWEPGRDISGQF